MAEKDFLSQIVSEKEVLLKGEKAYFAHLRKKAKDAKLTRYHLFKNAISKPGRVNLIAEIKKASPSRGLIVQDFNLLKIAKEYVDAGADAISVLTEKKYFLGKPSYVRQVSENFPLPVLVKDFIIDEVQLYEAFCFGASAVLLIVAILERPRLKELFSVAQGMDLDCLVEVHDEKELETALSAGAEIVGVNNRDLHTFKVDLTTSERLIPLVPKDKTIVVESGIATHEDIVKFQKLGANAVLIGETFLRAPDVGKKIKEVMLGS